MDTLLQLLETVVTSPWLYALVLVVVAVDSVLPVLPGETVVITAAAYAAVLASPDPWLLLAVTVAGALGGDVIAHHLGRGAGPIAQRVRRVRAGEKLLGWAENALLTRGGPMIVTARFIPGGRTATTLTSGVIGYPRGKFVAFAGLAAVLWASYNVAIGMIGGLAFRENPLIGVVIGVGIALAAGILVDRLRIARNNRRRARGLPVIEDDAPLRDREAVPAGR